MLVLVLLTSGCPGHHDRVRLHIQALCASELTRGQNPRVATLRDEHAHLVRIHRRERGRDPYLLYFQLLLPGHELLQPDGPSNSRCMVRGFFRSRIEQLDLIRAPGHYR